MASLSYDKIFSEFLGNMTDPTIANLDKTQAYEIMTDYLHKAVSSVYVRRLFSSISFDDEVQEMTYEMAKKTDDNADNDFVQVMLGKAMILQWITPQVQSKVNLAQMFTGSDQRFFSQASHVSELRAMKSDIEKDLQSFILTRGYVYNDYLEDN